MAALTLTAAVAGNMNGDASVAYTFANGSTGADTIANAQLLKGLAPGSRIATFLANSFLTQAALDAAAAQNGLQVSVNGGSLLTLVTAAPGVPTATMTTAGGTGSLRISLGSSISS